MIRGSPPPCKREPSPCQNSKTNTETNFQLGTQSSEAVKAPSSEIPGLSQAPPLTGEEISHPSPHLTEQEQKPCSAKLGSLSTWSFEL